MEDYSNFFKQWCELYVHFCWHKKETPKQITDEVLFKKEFTYERWKNGYWVYNNNKLINYTINNELNSVKLKSLSVRLEYNLYRDVPFNIKYILQ